MSDAGGVELDLPVAGLRCIECGEILPSVDRTKTNEGFIARERRCLKCGTINDTDERVINARRVRTYVQQNGEGI